MLLNLERVPSCVFKVLLFMLGFPSVIQQHLAMFQMEGVPLTDLVHAGQNPRIKVRASRVYHHRGGLEFGEVKDIRIVFIDARGDSMYALMPEHLSKRNTHQLQEGSVYEVSQFEVSHRQRTMNPVENPLIIVITDLTVIRRVLRSDPKFPKWTCRLTSIQRLPTPPSAPRQSLDVIGVIRGVTELAVIYMPTRNSHASVIKILLDDGSGYEIVVTLFSECAEKFCRLGVPSFHDNKLAVVIFVGLDVTMSEGVIGLSGAGTCRWYINEDIPAIRVLQSNLRGSVRPIIRLPRPRCIRLRIPCRNFYPTRPLSLLLDTDFFNYQVPPTCPRFRHHRRG